MVTKFTRKELERLKCTKEEIELVINYQKLLPIPNEDFEINARTLHEYLGVGKKVTTWIQGRIEKYHFKKNIDYLMRYESNVPNFGNTDFTSFSPIQLSRMGVKKEYYLTANTCKELCTIENNELGRLARRYFILMEKIVKDNEEWYGIRNPERKAYNDMYEAISSNVFRSCGRTADKYDFARDANILNVICTGAKAQSIRNYFNLTNNSELTRDSLETDYNQKISFLQKQNIICLGMNMPIVERVKFLISAFDITYPLATPLLSYMSRDDMECARNELVGELERK